MYKSNIIHTFVLDLKILTNNKLKMKNTESKKIKDLGNIEWIKLNFKWWFRRTKIKVIKKFNSAKYLQESVYENIAVTTCRNIIRTEGTILLGNMKTQDRYIRTNDDEIYIIVKSGVIEIINHTYHYVVQISEKGYDRICKVFDGHQDLDRQAMDDEIRLRIRHSLQLIYEKAKSNAIIK